MAALLVLGAAAGSIATAPVAWLEKERAASLNEQFNQICPASAGTAEQQAQNLLRKGWNSKDGKTDGVVRKLVSTQPLTQTTFELFDPEHQEVEAIIEGISWKDGTRRVSCFVFVRNLAAPARSTDLGATQSGKLALSNVNTRTGRVWYQWVNHDDAATTRIDYNFSPNFKNSSLTRFSTSTEYKATP